MDEKNAMPSLRSEFSILAGEAAKAMSCCPLEIARDVSLELRSAAANFAPQNAEMLRHFPAVDAGFFSAICDFFDAAEPKNSLFAAAVRVGKNLPWRFAGGGKSREVGVTELIGPDGAAFCEFCRVGLVFQPPQIFYPWHRHLAEEIYLPIGGEAEWLSDGKNPDAVLPMSGFVHHFPWQAHAIRTGDSPLFALWGWRGDISVGSYERCDAP